MNRESKFQKSRAPAQFPESTNPSHFADYTKQNRHATRPFERLI